MKSQPWRLALVLALLSIATAADATSLKVGWERIGGVDLFYREGGDLSWHTILFLHGNPASSLQYEGVMERLAASYHVLAIDYPSFGFSAAPDRGTYEYTFDHISETVREFLKAHRVSRYALFMQDYGVPVGFRLLARAPDLVTALIVQNGVIHLDGFPAAADPDGELRRHWKSRNAALDSRRQNFTERLPYPQPDGWDWPDGIPPEFVIANLASARRPGVMAARNDLWFDYGTNVDRYPSWQALLKQITTPLLVVWGGHDTYFTVPAAFAYLRERPAAEVHILDADHFATVEVPDQIADLVRRFLDANLPGSTP